MHQTGNRGGDNPPSEAKTDVLTESGRAGVPPRFLACVLLAAWCARGFAPPTPAQSGRAACVRRRPPSNGCSLAVATLVAPGSVGNWGECAGGSSFRGRYLGSRETPHSTVGKIPRPHLADSPRLCPRGYYTRGPLNYADVLKPPLCKGRWPSVARTEGLKII